MTVHRFAIVTACATFLLVVAGGLVTSTGSGMSVPDWPLSYGQLMPPMKGGVAYEHGHRMVATAVGLLTLVLAVWLSRVERRFWVKLLGWSALASVVIQGLLGGMTVLFLLPTPLSVAHAVVAQSFFALVVVIAMATSPGWQRSVRPLHPAVSITRIYASCTVLVILLQLVIGAWMRHSNAGLAIPDFPLSYGRVLPPADFAKLPEINQMRESLDLSPVDLGQIWIHFAHRVGALVVVLASLVTMIHIWRAHRDEPRLRTPAIILFHLVLVQGFLGALTVLSGKAVGIATVHVVTGALLLALAVVVAVRSFQLFRTGAEAIAGETGAALEPAPVLPASQGQ